jgi:hypothetical protein
LAARNGPWLHGRLGAACGAEYMTAVLGRFAEVAPHSSWDMESLFCFRTRKDHAMPDALEFLLYLAALTCFLLAAFGHRARWTGRVNLIGLGLACWVFIHVVSSLRRVS